MSKKVVGLNNIRDTLAKFVCLHSFYTTAAIDHISIATSNCFVDKTLVATKCQYIPLFMKCLHKIQDVCIIKLG